jgi:thymidine phosphorylase
MKQFDLQYWLKRRELTSLQLAQYLTSIGYEVSQRTVEMWRSTSRPLPKWVGPTLATRDALLDLYERHDVVANSVLLLSHALEMRPIKDEKLIKAANAADKACDEMEGIFESFLTEKERGLDKEP